MYCSVRAEKAAKSADVPAYALNNAAARRRMTKHFGDGWRENRDNEQTQTRNTAFNHPNALPSSCQHLTNATRALSPSHADTCLPT